MSSRPESLPRNGALSRTRPERGQRFVLFACSERNNIAPGGPEAIPMQTDITFWVLSDGRPGHEAQALGLAEAL
ncbi:MAG TPA: hypothetical protein VFJ13_03990, partial [Paracoccaceae bacterium]|nr:hypothetical protein [Paracoccaceae bacterium]